MFTALILSLALAAAPPPKAASSETMKNLMKDAASEGPDVSKLPFTADSIKQIVVSYQPKIQSCYEEHLANKKQSPEGNLKTSFIITADGFVKGAKIDKKASSLKDAGLHDCVIAVLSTMAFPKPPDAKDHPIDFPFNLKAVH